MIRNTLVLAAAALSGAALATPAAAQNEQFVPILSYRTGAYAVNGVPYRQRRVRLLQPGQRARRRHQRRQAPRRGVRDRLRHRQGRGVLRAPQGQGPDRRGVLQPAVDRHHLRADREGAGRQDPDHHHGIRPRRLQERRRASPGTSRCSAPTGRRPTSPSSTWPRSSAASTTSRARRSRSSSTTAPTARSRSRRCRRWPPKHGFEFTPIPVTHPGVEQKSQWLAIRQNRPDYVLLWGWGVMNGTAVKEAAAVAYPRDKMIGVWWSGAEPDVTPAGDDAKGYKALTLQHGAGNFKVHEDIKKHVYDKGKGLAQGRLRPGALQSRRGQRHAGRRGDPQGAGEVRQEAAHGRAGALGPREPQPLGRRASRSWASRAC